MSAGLLVKSLACFAVAACLWVKTQSQVIQVPGTKKISGKGRLIVARSSCTFGTSSGRKTTVRADASAQKQQFPFDADSS